MDVGCLMNHIDFGCRSYVAGWSYDKHLPPRYRKDNLSVLGYYLTDEITSYQRSWTKEVYGRGRNYRSIDFSIQISFF
jgi:hypothetical protein